VKSGCDNAVWVSPSHHLHSQSDKYRQEKEAIKVDFIRWVLIFKIEVEVNEIGSSIAVKVFVPKEGVPLETS
jgi:hypothetical protein